MPGTASRSPFASEFRAAISSRFRCLHAKRVANSREQVMTHSQQVVACSWKEKAVFNWKEVTCSWKETTCCWKELDLEEMTSMEWATVVQKDWAHGFQI